MASTNQFTVVIEPDENCFHAYVPAAPGCHSFGDTVEDALANIKEAIALHIECMRESGEEVPQEPDPIFVTRVSAPAAV